MSSILRRSTTRRVYTPFARRLLVVAALWWAVGSGGLAAADQGSATALRLDGVDDYVDFGVGPAFRAHTIEAWVNLPPIVLPNNLQIVGNYGADVNGCYTGTGLFLSVGWSGEQRFKFVVGRTGCGNDAVLISNPFTTGVWHHLAGTYDGSTMRFYVDGVLVAARSGIGFDPFDRMLIGASWVRQGVERPSDFHPFDIEEFRLWDHVRTECEIRDSACRTLSGQEPGLIGYWRLNEGAGQTVFDSSPSGINGTLGSNANLAGDAGDPAWVVSQPHACPAVLVISCPADITMMINLGTTDAVVSYSAPIATDSCSVPIVNCSKPSGSSFPVGTTTVSCTATDSSNNAGECAFLVTVLTPQGAAQQLIDKVNTLVSQGVLNQGNGNALIAKLQAVISSMNSGNKTAACNQLQAFIKQTQAFINTGKLTTAQGQPLINSANGVMSVLGC